MALLNWSLWQERFQQHKGLSLAPDPRAQTQLSWGRSWKMGPPLLPTARGSGAGRRSHENAQTMEKDGTCNSFLSKHLLQGNQGREETKALSACSITLGSHPCQAPRAGSGSCSPPKAQAWPWIPLCSRSSVGTRVLCAWSSVPAYSTHLLLFHLPA